jgi:elongation factor P
MVLASDIKVGMVLQLDGRLHKVLDVVRHAGAGQMHGFLELKMKDLKFGHLSDRHCKLTDKFEEAEITKRQMDYLYKDGESFFFMDTVTFEQVSVPKTTVGTIEKFFGEGTHATIELFGGEAVSIQFPKILELKVIMTGSGKREGQDNTMKPATLENNVEILVPQFIETGDVVRVDTEKVKYVDRVTLRKV